MNKPTGEQAHNNNPPEKALRTSGNGTMAQSTPNPLEAELDRRLRVGESFDLLKKQLTLDSGGYASLYYIDGFVKDQITEKLMEYYIKTPPEELSHNIPYVEVENTDDIERMVTSVLSGATVMLLPSQTGGIVIDTRSYPTRGIEEPGNDRVLRGPRDGFCETLIFNTALIRRRIRDPRLTFEIFNIGEYTRTDVALAYIEGRADKKFVETMRKKLSQIKIKALNFGAESLAECFVKRRWWNPFPKFRYTERPDAAAAMLGEGSVLVICDNTPSVMLLPTSIFDFLQETDDFCLPPLTASYLRLLRLGIYIVTLYLTPVWYYLISHPERLPDWLSFIALENPGALPVLVQLLLAEFAIDGLKLAALNTPSMLTSSLSVVGGLILGDFAVGVGWIGEEVIFYMAFVALANFTQPSYELGYAFKFMRLIMLLFTGLFDLVGLAVGIVLVNLFIALNKTVDGSRSYLYPLIPFNAQAMKRLFFRVRLK